VASIVGREEHDAVLVGDLEDARATVVEVPGRKNDRQNLGERVIGRRDVERGGQRVGQRTAAVNPGYGAPALAMNTHALDVDLTRRAVIHPIMSTNICWRHLGVA